MFDYTEEAKSFALADAGVYELRIDNAELKKSDSGKNFIALTLVVRDDVQQKFQGVKIWDNIWENDVFRDSTTGEKIKKAVFETMSPDKKNNVTVTKEYDDFKIRKLIHAQDCDLNIKDANGNDIKNPEYKTTFGSIQEVVQFLNQMCVQVKVDKYNDEKSGQERNSIDYRSLTRTSVTPQPMPDAEDETLPWL